MGGCSYKYIHREVQRFVADMSVFILLGRFFARRSGGRPACYYCSERTTINSSHLTVTAEG